MATRYTAKELRALPTLSIGQADDLKIETADTRVWISRCGVDDGKPYNDKITVERRAKVQLPGKGFRNAWRWVVVEVYCGD